MATNKELREKLLHKLTELFQLDQPDLDFGFYRIMHAKAQQVQDFIDRDLLQIIESELSRVNEKRKTELQALVQKEIEMSKAYGAPEPEKAPKVVEAKTKYEQLQDTYTAETDVYNHLYRFFERYYDAGDFISRRYYSRESSSTAAPFAIPYNGEEVKLHWANADQYYIKTTEYFSNYTFDIIQAKEIRTMPDEERTLNKIPRSPCKVHFRIVEASEGEHGNIKAAEDKKRFFVLHNARPVEFNQQGELLVNFEYTALPGGKNDVDTETEELLKEAYSPNINKRDMPSLAIAQKIIQELKNMQDTDSTETETLPRNSVKNYLLLLATVAPSDKNPRRPLLAKYITQYTARNTCDYFIHKDLGSFLKRELDFYIKNEVMNLDDIENAEAPAVDSYLTKLKVIRTIATTVIEFLAQLENFQKKLWLKKKFVVESNYCMTLDRVPEALYPEIARNHAQHEEWVKLFAINEIGKPNGEFSEMVTPAYSLPLTVEFLKANNKLVLDTAFFDDDFKAKLIASIQDFDERTDGLLIHSENFQALNLLQERYKEQVKCVYIDPPYNTAASEILYKNSYKHSSWLSLIENRILLGKIFLSQDGMQCTTIDDFEFHKLRELIVAIFGNENIAGIVAIKNNPSGRSTVKGFSIAHEYGIFTFASDKSSLGVIPRTHEQLSQYREKDERGQFQWRSFLRSGGSNDTKIARPKLHYPIKLSNEAVSIPEMDWNEHDKEWVVKEEIYGNEKLFYPICNSVEYTWRLGVDTLTKRLHDLRTRISQQGKRIFEIKFYLDDEGVLPKTIWDDKYFNSTAYGTTLLRNIMGSSQSFSFPKSIFAVQQSLRVLGASNKNTTILDYFAGSGTTGHAVINLNREDGGKRTYILVEMGNYFDTVTKPRMQKVVYSKDWKDGKPVSREGISHCFKYLRLESYEDTLNNVRYCEEEKDAWIRSNATVRREELEHNGKLRKDYMLHYMLDVETRASQSLLNIRQFVDPWQYTLHIKKPGTDEIRKQVVDLQETFNYLIGLRVCHAPAPQYFDADFIRAEDPELPEDQETKLLVHGAIRERTSPSSIEKKGLWKFRSVEGWVPADPMQPNSGHREKVLVIWRTLPAYAQLRNEGAISEAGHGLEGDNLMLDEWFKQQRASHSNYTYDTIYVNGSNNLQNLKQDTEHWEVRLLEKEFHRRMWDTE